MRNIKLVISENDFKKFEELKEKDNSPNWEDFILKRILKGHNETRV
jgi:hypothetical protein